MPSLLLYVTVSFLCVGLVVTQSYLEHEFFYRTVIHLTTHKVIINKEKEKKKKNNNNNNKITQ